VAIGIANQRETTVVWDRATGQPVHKAIVWQDRRTADRCDKLRRDGLTELIRSRTGLVPDPYFSATKIAWILDCIPGMRLHAERGELAFGTIDSWLAWKLSGGELHVTDPSNASRTMLYDIHRGGWDDELLTLFGIPRSMLPEVRPSSHVFGMSAPRLLGKAAPIAGIAGDQQAALFGQACHEPGMAKNTYGTGCFMLLNTGPMPMPSRHGLLTTCNARLGRQGQHYALEGSVFVGGAVVQWLRDELKFVRTTAEIENLARSVENSNDVYLVPAFTGLGAPHWDPYARGALVGLTRGTSRAHIARAALESIAFQSAELLQSMQLDAGIGLTELRVDGGATANDLLMQFQADLLGVPVIRPRIAETTALGAAYLAGLATGLWKDTAAISRQWKAARRFKPAMGRAEAEERMSRWRAAVEHARGWAAR
jgi:glycerol kinase